jgi:hypothetical protein
MIHAMYDPTSLIIWELGHQLSLANVCLAATTRQERIAGEVAGTGQGRARRHPGVTPRISLRDRNVHFGAEDEHDHQDVDP